MFERSEETRGLRYVIYCGDQDSTTMESIWDPYSAKVQKKECVCHVAKKMGRIWRSLRNKMKNTKLADGKPLSEKGRLTDFAIQKTQNFYGKAIRENSESVPAMRKTIWAVYHHLQAKSAGDHDYCPEGPTSWCRYQKANSAGDADAFRHGAPRIAPSCMQACKPVFESLTEEALLTRCIGALLTRCIGAFSQNRNESFHNLVWEYAPKTDHVGRRVIEIATASAILDFNEVQAIKKAIYAALDLKNGENLDRWIQGTARRQKHQTRSRSSDPEMLSDGRSDKENSLPSEDDFYCAGAF